MVKRGYHLTPQRKLLRAFERLANEQGLEIRTKTNAGTQNPIFPNPADLRYFEEQSRKARIMVGEYIRRIEQAHKNAEHSTLVFKEHYQNQEYAA